MRRPRRRLEVSTFPFLAVLLCAMGSLILLLLVLDRRAKAAARVKAQQAAQMALAERDAAARAAADEAGRRAAERAARAAEREHLRAALHDQLAHAVDEVGGNLRTVEGRKSATARAAAAQNDRWRELLEILGSQRDELAKAERETAAGRGAAAEALQMSESARKEAVRLSAQLRGLEVVLDELKAARKREAQTYSLVPYKGKRGDGRRPIYLECTADGLVFHPDRKTLFRIATASEVRGEVEARVASQRQTVLAQGGKPDERAYLLMLVRPDGLAAYYATMAALRGKEIDFGYELIDADWVLDFPEGDKAPATQPWMTARRTAVAPADPSALTRKVSGLRPGKVVEGGGDELGEGDGGAAGNRGGSGLARGGSSGLPPLPGAPRGSGGAGGGFPGFSPPPGVPAGGTGGRGGPGQTPGLAMGDGGGSATGGTLGIGRGPGGSGTGGSGLGPDLPPLPGAPEGVAGAGRGWPRTSDSMAVAGGPSGSGVGGVPGVVAAPGGSGTSSGLPPSLPGAADGIAGTGRGSPRTPDSMASAGGVGSGGGGGSAVALAQGGSGANSGLPPLPSGSGPPGGTALGGGPAGGTSRPNPDGSMPGTGQGTPGAVTGQGPSGGTPGAPGTSAGGGSGSPALFPFDQTGQPRTGAGGQPGNSGGGGQPSGNAGNGQAGGTGSGGQPGSPGGGGQPAGAAGNGQPGASGQTAGTGDPGQAAVAAGMGRGGHGGGGEPQDPDAPQGPNLAVGMIPGGGRPQPPTPPRPIRFIGNRDWVIPIECRGDGVVLRNAGQKFPLESLTGNGTAESPLLQALKQMIARRQSGVRPGEPPYRPQVRFLIYPDGLKSYYLSFPALEPLGIPLTRQNVEPDPPPRPAP